MINTKKYKKKKNKTKHKNKPIMINENIIQLRIDNNDNLQKINYNLKLNNLYSLIGFFQNKRMNKTLTNINNSYN